MSVTHHTPTNLDHTHRHPSAYVVPGHTHSPSFPTPGGLVSIRPSLARYKPCDLTISCPNRSASLTRHLHYRPCPATPTTPTTNLSDASKVTNISSTNHPHTHAPAPSSGTLHPLPGSLDALDRSALEHVARMLYVDSVNSRSATVQARANAQRTRARMDEVERRTEVAIASLREHAEEEEAELRKLRDEVEALRRRLGKVSEVLSAVFPGPIGGEEQEGGGLEASAARIPC